MMNVTHHRQLPSLPKHSAGFLFFNLFLSFFIINLTFTTGLLNVFTVTEPLFKIIETIMLVLLLASGLLQYYGLQNWYSISPSREWVSSALLNSFSHIKAHFWQPYMWCCNSACSYFTWKNKNNITSIHAHCNKHTVTVSKGSRNVGPGS